jgi:predicted GTPase
MSEEDGLDIGLVGVCGAGKSTVARLLRASGYRVREIHQEHSYVAHMWRTIHPPQVLIFLDASYETARQRRYHPDYGPCQHKDMQHRLRDARANADVYVLTDGLTAEDVAQHVASALAQCRPPPLT